MPRPRTPHPVPLPGFGESRFDPLAPTDLLADEIAQRLQTGYDVADVLARARACDRDDDAAVLALVDALGTSLRAVDWPYDEPDTLGGIQASLPALPVASPVDPATVRDRIHAAWLGRIAGCTLGKPVEWGWHWTPAHIRDYLQRAGAYPLNDYIPVLDPMPAGFELRENWPTTTRGNVDGAARDDDIDFTILGLHLLERHGSALRTEDVAQAWLTLFPLRQLFTAERAAYVNLAAGRRSPEVATFRNPYREWIGAAIRGDAFGYVHPGDPWAAAALAYVDASLSHTGNGIYGEMFTAALVAAAFTAGSAAEAVAVAAQVVPPATRLAEAIGAVTDCHASGAGWDEAVVWLHEEFGRYSWVHTINNLAVVVASLLWGGGDYTSAVGRTVMSGWDTDSNGATVGSVMGALLGRDALPAHLVGPLHDTTRSALFGYDGSRISDLAERTYVLASGGLS